MTLAEVARQVFVFVLLCFTGYRITRLAILDTIFDAPRNAIHAWLLNGTEETRWHRGWRHRLACFIAGGIAGGIAGLAVANHVFDNRALAIAAWIGMALWIIFAYLVLTSGPTRLGAKIQEMLDCPYCLSVWVGLGEMLMIWPFHQVPIPLFYFLAVSSGSLMIYQYMDFEPDE